MAKKTLPPALQANADKLRRGESLHGKMHGKNGKTKDSKVTATATSQRPKIRSKQKKG